MATAPFQLWVDLPQVASASRTASTVTVTTSSAHGIATGAYVQMENCAGAAGTSMNTVAQVTVTSGTTFTYTAAGSAGTATIGSAAISQDLLNPLINYTGTARESALYVDLSSIQMSAAGDGDTSTMGFSVMQDDTPADGPWFGLIPDQARIRLYKADTGTVPTDADLYFVGLVSGIGASLNGSGQGTIADVTVDEVNAILDKLVVFGKELQARSPDGAGAFVRASNVVTVTTSSDHNYVAGDTQVKISGVNGGGTATFNGTFTVATTPTDTTFTYASTGADATGDTERAIGSIAFKSGSNQILVVSLSASAQHGLSSGDTLTLTGVSQTGGGGTLASLVNATYTGTSVKKTTATQLELTLSRAVTTKYPLSGGTLRGAATIVPVGGSGQTVIGINGGEDEGDAVRKVLRIVNSYKSKIPAVQRMLSTSTTSQIVSATDAQSTDGLSIPAGSLRSVLDAIVETYGGQDSKARRYYIDLNRRLNYRLVDPTAQPTYATAPYKIITTGVATPDTTTGAATLYPYSLTLNYDHQTTKQALFQISAQTGSPVTKVVSYTSVGYTERKNSPVFDDSVEFPTAATNPSSQVTRAARSYFLERHKPLLTGTLVIRGAGKADHNAYGFSAGYYQTGASTYALQKRWEPGQWMSVVCAELGLSGLYRVESVDWALEPGSFTQVITITFNRRNPNSLAAQIKRRS